MARPAPTRRVMAEDRRDVRHPLAATTELTTDGGER